MVGMPGKKPASGEKPIKKKHIFTIHFAMPLWNALQRRAADERRDYAEEVRMAVEEHLKQHGYWPPPEDK